MTIETASRQSSEFDELVDQLERTMDKLVGGQFSIFRPTDNWTPSVNAYRLADRIEICVDLAGVARQSIDITSEAGLLTLRGFRHPPQPESPDDAVQILMMEIDHGPFERRIALPRQVDFRRITAEQKNGLLWITLPLRRKSTAPARP